MRVLRAIALLGFVVLATRLFPQEGKAGFFSLDSTRTYAPGKKSRSTCGHKTSRRWSFAFTGLMIQSSFFLRLGPHINLVDERRVPLTR